MLDESKITKKGQIIIPKAIREKLGLKAGDKIIFESNGNGILIRKKEDSDINEIIEEVSGIWKEHPLFKNKTVKEIIEMIRGPDDETNKS
jgi:AbrB family looped-hinge helix DNA binding protein